MALKPRINTPQEHILVGMAFFLVGLFAHMVGDGRIIGAFCASLNHDQSALAPIQSIAGGILIPVSCASIYFNVRGLVMLRSKRLA